MSRTDGTFPKYTHIDLTDADEPVNYYDSSRRCGVQECNKHWPDHEAFKLSPCCNVDTVRDGIPPDMRWNEALFLLKKARFEAFYEEWNDGISDQQLAWIEVTTDGELDPEKVTKEIESFIEESQHERA